MTAGYAQSNQIQRLPKARQQHVYSLLDQIQNASMESDTAVLNACNAAIAELPHIGQFYLRRGDAYASKGDDKRALADYHHARSCDPTLAGDSVQFSTNVYCKQKRFDLALKELDTLPVNSFGLRGDPESRVFIYLQMGNRDLAESILRKYREQLIVKGTWSDQILSRFPALSGIKLEEPKPNSKYSAEASVILKSLSAFEAMPSKGEIENILGVKLTPGKSIAGSKTGLVGKREFFKTFVDEGNKQIYLTIENGISFLPAKDLLKDLNYSGQVASEIFYYPIRKTPSDPKLITLDFSGPFKGLSSATFSWNVAPDSPEDPLDSGRPAKNSMLLLEVLKKLDSAPKPIDKARCETITKCKLKKSENIYPDHFFGMTETETVWRTGTGFRSQKSWSVDFTPGGAYLNDSRFYVAPGADKVTRQGLDGLFGPGVELRSASPEWRVDSSQTVSYKRQYGSITAVFPNYGGGENAASQLWFWWKGESPYATLEEFETQRTSAVLCREAVQATAKNEFRRAAYLLRLAYMRGGFSQHSGNEKYELWKNIRAAYTNLYEKKGDSARAEYLRNVTCQKMNSDLIELESSSPDFPTLKEAEDVPWRIIHMPEGLAYRLQGDKAEIEIYRSSPNFRRCVELFGPMNSGADLFVKSIPADLFDSEYFGPGYYD